MVLTSPVAATWPVIPIFMGKRDSNGLVLSLRSSLASKSNTREKLPLDASCTNSIYTCGSWENVKDYLSCYVRQQSKGNRYKYRNEYLPVLFGTE